MNTLSRAFTARILVDAVVFAELRLRWRMLLASSDKHTLRAEHHMLYAMLLGRDWRRGFGPLSNPRTLANGGWFDMGVWRALTVIRIAAMQPTRAPALLAPFEGAVTIEMLQRLAAHVPAVQAWQLGPEAFANGFPFDAYVAEAVTP